MKGRRNEKLMIEELSFFESVDDAIRYKQDCIEVELLHHRNLCNIDTVSQLCYLEDADTKTESDGLLAKIRSGVEALMDKLLSIVKAIINGIKSGSNNHLVFDEWIESDDAQYQLQGDIQKMMSELDEQYLQMRTVVQKISAATGMDPKKVAEISDKAGATAEKVANFSHTKLAKKMVRGAAIKKMSKHLANQLYDVDNLTEENKKKVRQLKKDAGCKDRLTCYDYTTRALVKITMGYKKMLGSLKSSIHEKKRKRVQPDRKRDE